MNDDMIGFLILAGIILTPLVGLPAAFIGVNYATTKAQENIVVSRTFVVVSTAFREDWIFHFQSTEIKAFETARILEFWDAHPEFQAWHRYNVTSHVQWRYPLVNFEEILTVEDLGEFPIQGAQA